MDVKDVYHVHIKINTVRNIQHFGGDVHVKCERSRSYLSKEDFE